MVRADAGACASHPPGPPPSMAGACAPPEAAACRGVKGAHIVSACATAVIEVLRTPGARAKRAKIGLSQRLREKPY